MGAYFHQAISYTSGNNPDFSFLYFIQQTSCSKDQYILQQEIICILAHRKLISKHRAKQTRNWGGTLRISAAGRRCRGQVIRCLLGRSGELWAGRTGWNKGPARIPRVAVFQDLLWFCGFICMSVISQNYIRHRQKAKCGVQLAELRQYVVIAEWLTSVYLILMHWN